MIDDEQIPAAAHLLGAGARALIGAGISALGGELGSLRSTQVVYRPGHELTVRYEALVRWRGAPEAVETLCASASRRGAPPGTVPLVADGMEVGVWRYPFDPFLPGLLPAVTPSRAADLVGDLVGGAPSLTVCSYRPGRRAVVRAAATGGAVYLKVVPPAELPALAATHGTLHTAMPVPEVLRCDGGAGILVLRALPGQVLRARLRSGAGPWPTAHTLLDLLGTLARARPPEGARSVPPLGRDADRHLTVVERAEPRVRGSAEALRAVLAPSAATRAATTATSPLVLVHGDFHEGQLTVEGDRVAGLLDLDGIGWGDGVDDLARLLGHLSTLALGGGRHSRAIASYAERLHAGFARHVDPGQLALRTAAAVVGVATGPFRVQSPRWRAETRARLELAGRWARRAGGSTREHQRRRTSHEAA